MLYLRLIFLYNNYIHMSPWDLFGRTLTAGLYEYIPYFKKTTINKCYLRRTFFEAAALVTLGGQVISLSALTPAAVVLSSGWVSGGEDEAVISGPKPHQPVTQGGPSSRAGSHLARAENAESRS